MRPVKFAALLTLVCLALGGCQVSGEVENQAYALILGVERLENDRIGLTVRVPKIGKSGDAKESGGSAGSPYLTFSVAGASWPQALEALQLATPRPVNLSHIELVAVSRDLAGESGFPALLREIVETPHLYATARFAVCEGGAKAFIEAGETIIGTRMSAELRAMLAHYTDEGYIPEGSLADAYFAFNSIYSDPVACFNQLESSENGADGDPQSLESPMKQRYCGAALFRAGTLVDTLSLAETRLLNLIRGQSRAFPFDCDGRHFELTPEGKPKLRADVNEGAPRLGISLRLSAPEDVCGEDADRLEGALQEDIAALVRACQSMACDPFGFAEVAAGRFQTVSEWLAYDWRGHYAEASVDVSVEIRSEGE